MKVDLLACAIYGPVGNASHGGHSSPPFDLLVGTAVLLLTWWGVWNTDQRGKTSLLVRAGISAICLVFIVSGLLALFA